MSDELDGPATSRDISNLRIELVDRMQHLDKEMIDLRGAVSSLRNSVWLQIVVPSVTLIVSVVIHYFFR